MRIGGNGNVTFPPRWVTGRYYACSATGTFTTSAAMGVGTVRAAPFYVPNDVTVTKIGAEVTVVGDAGSKVRLGIYADDGTGRPGNLVIDAGTINGDSATVQEITISQVLRTGWYWACATVQVVGVTQPTLRVLQHGMLLCPDQGSATPGAGSTSWGFGVTGVTGALPSTFGTPSTSGLVPRIFVKV